MSHAYISSKDNSQFKQLKKLANSARERRKTGKTFIDGVHLIQALADTGLTPDLVLLRENHSTNPEIDACLKHFADVPLITLEHSLFDSLSPVETPVGILALIAIPTRKQSKYQSAVLLENIQDPGNLGSIIRTAAAAGMDVVYLSKGCAEAWSPKALRAGMGAQLAIDIVEQADLIKVCEQYPTTLATSLDAQQSIYDVDLGNSLAFIFGNEGAGLSKSIQEKATQLVNIPMPGRVESLNVNAAVSACLFERVRQLTKNK